MAEELVIRRFRASDWDAVCGNYDAAKPDELQGVVAATAIPALQDDPHMCSLFDASAVVVAEWRDQVLAFAGNRQSHIAWLFVHPLYRRRGLAKALLRCVLADIDGSVTLNVAKSNLAARNLYAGFGFFVEREFDGAFNGQACPAMRLTLAVGNRGEPYVG